MRAGRLRHRVTIQQQAETQSATTGAAAVTWSTFAADVPAEVLPLSGREFVAAQAGQAEVVARATIRYLAGVTAAMRLSFDSRIYNIRAVLPDPTARHYLTLMLAEGVNDGR